MKIKNYLYFLILGQLAVAASILLNRFLPESGFGDFLVGILVGLGLVFNLIYLISFGKK